MTRISVRAKISFRDTSPDSGGNGVCLELYLFKLAHYFWRQVDHACLSNPAWYINLQYFSKLAQYFC